MRKPGNILIPLAAAASGATLLITALAGTPPVDPRILVAPLAAAPLAALPKLVRKRATLAVYEVKLSTLPRRQASNKVKLLAELVKSIGRGYGVAALLTTCTRRGCATYLLMPEDEKLDTLVKGVMLDADIRRLNVDPALLLERGGGDDTVVAEYLEADATSLQESTTSGEVLLGVKPEDNTPIYAKVEEFWRHTGVFGTTGSGKTTTTSFLVSQLSRHVRVIIFDWHGEYPENLKRLDTEFREIEPPRIPLIPDDLDIEIIANILEDAFDLTRHQSMLLYQALKSMKKREALPDDINEFTDTLLATVEVQQAVPSRAELEIRAALERRLRGLVTGEGRRYFRVKGSLDVPVDANLIVIRVDKILFMSLRRIYVKMFLAYLYYTALSTGKKLDTIVVLEEAHNIASTDTRTIPAILAEARKRHLGLIIVTQSPSSLHPSVLKNTNIRIIHTLKSAQDIAVVAKSMSLTPEQRTMLPKLPVGYAIVDTPQLENPVLVHIPIDAFSVTARRQTQQ